MIVEFLIITESSILLMDLKSLGAGSLLTTLIYILFAFTILPPNIFPTSFDSFFYN